MAFTLTSRAFQYGGTIPAHYTCDGEDVSPPLAWTSTPEGCKSLALVMDDPDAPSGTFTHWLLCDVPVMHSALDEGFNPGQVAMVGTNGFRNRGYGGPCPPKGHGPHRYRFHLHALRERLNLKAGYSRADIDRALGGRILQTAVLVGLYERK